MSEEKTQTESSGPVTPSDASAKSADNGTERDGNLRFILPAAVALSGAYVGAQMLSDIASLKIGFVAGMAVDMGTFVYPVTFTLRDLIHKVLGKRAAQSLVLTAAAVNLVMAAYLGWASGITAAPGYALAAEFSSVLAPVWRIVVASIAAEVVSELLDTEIYHQFVKHTKKHQWARVLLSNSVSVPVDNLIFAVGAFALVLPWTAVAQIFFANLVVKSVVTFIGLPLIYLIPSRFESNAA